MLKTERQKLYSIQLHTPVQKISWSTPPPSPESNFKYVPSFKFNIFETEKTCKFTFVIMFIKVYIILLFLFLKCCRTSRQPRLCKTVSISQYTTTSYLQACSSCSLSTSDRHSYHEQCSDFLWSSISIHVCFLYSWNEPFWRQVFLL